MSYYPYAAPVYGAPVYGAPVYGAVRTLLFWLCFSLFFGLVVSGKSCFGVFPRATLQDTRCISCLLFVFLFCFFFFCFLFLFCSRVISFQPVYGANPYAPTVVAGNAAQAMALDAAGEKIIFFCFVCIYRVYVV
jgi:hypothetical protein